MNHVLRFLLLVPVLLTFGCMPHPVEPSCRLRTSMHPDPLEPGVVDCSVTDHQR
jgi:hypothetical protein